MRTWKKAISSLLVLCFLVSLLPIGAFAATPTGSLTWNHGDSGYDVTVTLGTDMEGTLFSDKVTDINSDDFLAVFLPLGSLASAGSVNIKSNDEATDVDLSASDLTGTDMGAYTLVEDAGSITGLDLMVYDATAYKVEVENATVTFTKSGGGSPAKVDDELTSDNWVVRDLGEETIITVAPVGNYVIESVDFVAYDGSSATLDGEEFTAENDGTYTYEISTANAALMTDGYAYTITVNTVSAGAVPADVEGEVIIDTVPYGIYVDKVNVGGGNVEYYVYLPVDSMNFASDTLSLKVDSKTFPVVLTSLSKPVGAVGQATTATDGTDTINVRLFASSAFVITLQGVPAAVTEADAYITFDATSGIQTKDTVLDNTAADTTKWIVRDSFVANTIDVKELTNYTVTATLTESTNEETIVAGTTKTITAGTAYLYNLDVKYVRDTAPHTNSGSDVVDEGILTIGEDEYTVLFDDVIDNNSTTDPKEVLHVNVYLPAVTMNNAATAVPNSVTLTVNGVDHNITSAMLQPLVTAGDHSVKEVISEGVVVSATEKYDLHIYNSTAFWFTNNNDIAVKFTLDATNTEITLPNSTSQNDYRWLVADNGEFQDFTVEAPTGEYFTKLESNLFTAAEIFSDLSKVSTTTTIEAGTLYVIDMEIAEIPATGDANESPASEGSELAIPGMTDPIEDIYIEEALVAGVLTYSVYLPEGNIVSTPAGGTTVVTFKAADGSEVVLDADDIAAGGIANYLGKGFDVVVVAAPIFNVTIDAPIGETAIVATVSGAINAVNPEWIVGTAGTTNITVTGLVGTYEPVIAITTLAGTAEGSNGTVTATAQIYNVNITFNTDELWNSGIAVSRPNLKIGDDTHSIFAEGVVDANAPTTLLYVATYVPFKAADDFVSLSYDGGAVTLTGLDFTTSAPYIDTVVTGGNSDGVKIRLYNSTAYVVTLSANATINFNALTNPNDPNKGDDDRGPAAGTYWVVRDRNEKTEITVAAAANHYVSALTATAGLGLTANNLVAVVENENAGVLYNIDVTATAFGTPGKTDATSELKFGEYEIKNIYIDEVRTGASSYDYHVFLPNDAIIADTGTAKTLSITVRGATYNFDLSSITAATPNGNKVTNNGVDFYFFASSAYVTNFKGLSETATVVFSGTNTPDTIKADTVNWVVRDASENVTITVNVPTGYELKTFKVNNVDQTGNTYNAGTGSKIYTVEVEISRIQVLEWGKSENATTLTWKGDTYSIYADDVKDDITKKVEFVAIYLPFAELGDITRLTHNGSAVKIDTLTAASAVPFETETANGIKVKIYDSNAYLVSVAGTDVTFTANPNPKNKKDDKVESGATMAWVVRDLDETTVITAPAGTSDYAKLLEGLTLSGTNYTATTPGTNANGTLKVIKLELGKYGVWEKSPLSYSNTLTVGSGSNAKTFKNIYIDQYTDDGITFKYQTFLPVKDMKAGDKLEVTINGLDYTFNLNELFGTTPLDPKDKDAFPETITGSNTTGGVTTTQVMEVYASAVYITTIEGMPASNASVTFSDTATGSTKGSDVITTNVKDLWLVRDYGENTRIAIANTNTNSKTDKFNFDGDKVLTAYKNHTSDAGIHYVEIAFSTTTTTPPSSGGGGGGGGYTITASAGENGTISPSGRRAVSSGGSLTFTITANEGYEVNNVLVDGSSVGAVETYTFSNVKANHTISATFKVEGSSGVTVDQFSDLVKGSWYMEAVTYAIEAELFNGLTETTFGPNNNMNRAMFVTVLGRYAEAQGASISGSASFTDVQSGWYYEKYVGWANANGLVTGYNSSTFAPNDNITREQMAVILVRFADYMDIELSNDNTVTFNDANSVSSWAVEGVEAAAAAGIVNGDQNGAFNPQNNSTRAEVAQVFYNFISE